MREQLSNLLDAVVQGDQNAFGRLSELYTPLIRSMSARFIESLSAQNDAGLIDVQDLEQEARLALFRAVNSYNRKQQDVSFGLYAKICIRNAFISQLRKAKTSRARIAEHELVDGRFVEHHVAHEQRAQPRVGRVDRAGCTAIQ
ncbi:MAG: hypothetical protein II227_02800, partial [Clostridia bacterium]|nr:hypothetical protein [Clostridia bacterium]